jgi:probable phosphoglycerate mutase
MRLYLIRHADPDYANDTITPAGHLEAKALAERLATHGLDRLYCSPLGRARATAQYACDLLKLDPIVEPWLAELSGCSMERSPWGKIVAWDCPGEVIRATAAESRQFDEKFYAATFSPVSVRECFEEVIRNSDDFLARLGFARDGGRYRIVEPNKLRIAVVCHGGFGLTWLAHLLEIPLPLMWSGFWLPPTSVTTILFDERSQQWAVPRCIGVGDVGHLFKAGLPVQPSGIKANFD